MTTNRTRRSLAVAAVATASLLGVANTSAFAAPAKVAAKTTKIKHKTTSKAKAKAAKTVKKAADTTVAKAH